MLKDLKTYLLYSNRYCGIEHTLVNGQPQIFATLLKKNKKEASIESYCESKTIKELALHLSKDLGVFLVLNDDNVITKKIENEQREVLKLVHTAFPNLNFNDFFYEVVQQETIHFISICRKSYIEQLVADYKANGISIINVSIGNSIISSIVNFINSESVYTSNTLISIENQNIRSIEKLEVSEKETYSINGLNVSSEHLVSLSASLTALLDNSKTFTNFESTNKPLLNDFKQSRFVKQSLKFGLLFIFGLLLINFIGFNYYFNKVSVLEQRSQVNQNAKSKVKELTDKIKASQETVEVMLTSSSSKSSYYINAIVQSLPSSVQLSEINYQPLLKRIKDNEQIQYDSKVLLVSGESNNSELFSYWMNDLEKNSWIQSIEIRDYSDVSNVLSTFSIKLNLKHDK